MHSTIVQPRHNLFGPHCPHCHEPIKANHLFCRSCGASQIVPGFDRAFCPFCGTRVSNRQEFCHECCGHLMPEETASQEMPRPSFLQHYSHKFAGWVNRHLQASLITAGLIIILITGLALTRTALFAVNAGPNQAKFSRQGILVAKETGPGQSVVQKSPASVPSSPGVAPPQAQLTRMLNRIRQAQLNKDINLFLSSFSPNFPELEEKRQKVLKTWQVYDFVNMNFEIQDIQKQDDTTVSAKVYWQVEFKNQNSNEIRQLDKHYYVSFAKEGDQWLIKDM